MLSRFTIAMLILAVTGLVVFAQAGGAELTGEVRDPNGALLSNARINITQVATEQTTTVVVTNGSYEIGNLRPGAYNFTI